MKTVLFDGPTVQQLNSSIVRQFYSILIKHGIKIGLRCFSSLYIMVFFKSFLIQSREDKLQNPDDYHIPVAYRTKELSDKHAIGSRKRFEEEGRSRSRGTLS